MKRLLVVDDDPHLREVVEYTLRREGYDVRSVGDGRAALQALEGAHGFALVVLDVTMPELDGLEVCRRLRAKEHTPIVFLSSKDEEIDRIVGLELGGDDYITKPFSPRELSARVRAVLRRFEAAQSLRNDPTAQSLLQSGDLRLDRASHEVFFRDQVLRLTVTEFGVIESLMKAPGRVLSRAQLMETAYAYDHLITERTMDTHIKRIRKKFKDCGFDPIETVHGVGYKLRR